jgi:hypothetical protein
MHGLSIIFCNNNNRNAIYLGGEWYLLDVAWSAGYVRRAKYVQEFTDQYFLARPKRFIMDHYPITPHWQLLEPVVPKHHFELFVKVTPVADRFGAFPEKQEHINAAIEVDNAFIVIPFHSDPVEVRVKLIPMIKDHSEEYEQATALAEDDKFHFVHHFVNGGFLLYVMFPFVGSYNLLIFLRERKRTYNNQGRVPNSPLAANPTTTNTITDDTEIDLTPCELAFEYIIKSKKGLMYDVGFPTITRFMREGGRVVAPLQKSLVWGSTCAFKLQLPSRYIAVMVKIMGRTKTYLNNDKGVEFYTFHGDVEIELDIDDSYDRHAQQLRELRQSQNAVLPVEILGFDESDAAWKILVSYEGVRSLKQINFGNDMNIPQFIEIDIPHVIESPARSAIAKIRRAVKVISFLHSTSPTPEHSHLSTGPNTGRFSVSTLFSPFVDTQFRKQFSVQSLSHPFMWIMTRSDSLTMHVSVQHENLRLRPLPLEQYGTELACQTTWMAQPEKGLYVFKIVCPKPEHYIFKIEGRVGDHEPFTMLRYVIDCNAWHHHAHPRQFTSSALNERRVHDSILDALHHELSFPKVFPPFFDHRCILYLPYEVLTAGRSYLFKVCIPGTEHVGVMTSGSWQPLACNDDEKGIFEGYVKINDSPVQSLPPDAFLCISKRKPLQQHSLVFGDSSQKNVEIDEEDFDNTGGDQENMIKLCEWHVLKVGQDISPPEYNILADYDEETLVEPTHDMLRYMRFISHKRKLISVPQLHQEHGNEFDNIHPHVSIMFKRVTGGSIISSYARSTGTLFTKQVSDFEFLIGNLSHDVQKVIREAVNSEKRSEFSYYDNDKTDHDHERVIMTAELFDALSPIEGAVLVQQSGIGLRSTMNEKMSFSSAATDFYQVHVTIPPDRTSRRYLLRIKLVASGKWRREYEGVNYWIHVENETLENEYVSHLEEVSNMDLDEDEITKKRDFDTTLSEVYKKNSIPPLTDDQEKNVSPFSTISKVKLEHFNNMYAQYLSRSHHFGFVRVDPTNGEWFRITIYQPTQYSLVRGHHYKVKIKLFNTNTVAMCCCIQTKSTAKSQLHDWQYLENDHMAYLESGDKADKSEIEFRDNRKHIYEGDVCFTFGTHVLLMAKADTNHYTPIATYELV